MPFIHKKDRAKEYEPIIDVLKKGLVMAVSRRDKGHINYVISRALMLAWKELKWGYNNASDLKSIIADVHDEFNRRMGEYEAVKQWNNKDIVEGFEEFLEAERRKGRDVTPPKPIVKPPDKKILDKDGKEIKK